MEALKRLLSRFKKNPPTRPDLHENFRIKYNSFKDLLSSNTDNLKIIADLEEKLIGKQIFGMSYIKARAARLIFHTYRMINSLDVISRHRYPALLKVFENMIVEIKKELEIHLESSIPEFILPFSQVDRSKLDGVGGKNANLGEVLNKVGLPVPQGFAVTTAAFNAFLAQGELTEEIDKRRIDIDPHDPRTLNEVSLEIKKIILSYPLPARMEEEFLSAFDRLEEDLIREKALKGPLRVALRSSALSEDSELSFAGQYVTYLNVTREQLVDSYKQIIAGLYNPRAITYRLNKGIRVEDIAMAVVCIRMINSIASGIVYSRHPFRLVEDDIIINAIWGLGPYIVGGVVTPDSYKVSRKQGLPILDRQISVKSIQLINKPEGGLEKTDVPMDRQNRPCLEQEQIRTLAEYALRLEEYFGCPQDIEWALDENGRLLVLQARPLKIQTFEMEEVKNPEDLRGATLLMEGGATAFPGVAYGRAFHAETEEDLADFPEEAILITKQASPKFVVVMRKAAGIITDIGSVSGHMASLAREFALPTLLDTKTATTAIHNDQWITLDAYRGKVYQGKVEPLLSIRKPRNYGIQGTPLYESLKRISQWIIPLNLTDPKSAAFSPKNCKSLHDIMRFIHEVSYSEMFNIYDTVSHKGDTALKIDAPLALDLYVIDLGSGIRRDPAAGKKVRIAEIVSVPFNAILKGMMHKDLLFMEPRPVELGGFLSVMSEQMFTNPLAMERFGNKSYALISDKYVNFSSRVGYHFSILDSYCGRDKNKNYVSFSFKGGAADDVRRNRRVRALALILQNLGFINEVKGDMVTARILKIDCDLLEEKIEMLGRLIQFSRQLDMLMANESSVESLAKCFLDGNYKCEPRK